MVGWGESHLQACRETCTSEESKHLVLPNEAFLPRHGTRKEWEPNRERAGQSWSLESLRSFCIWILSSFLFPGVLWLWGIEEKGLFTSGVCDEMSCSCQVFSLETVPKVGTAWLCVCVVTLLITAYLGCPLPLRLWAGSLFLLQGE